MKRIIAMAIVTATALSLGLVGSASAATTTGTWSQYPEPALMYQADVQQPINTTNTSNWSSKSKGAIPVMFKLSSGTGPAAFKSVATQAFAWASFTPDPGLTFGDIAVLETDYTFTTGNCHGGSLRWEIGTATGNLFIYYGDAPNFTDCTTNSQSGVNMIGLSDLRYDTTQLGGTFYDTYAHAGELLGTNTVESVSLVIDGGWAGDQVADVSNITVNDNVYQWDAGGTGVAPTCDLPDATIQVSLNDPVIDGQINEQPIQGALADDGNAFRVVDCKYQYNLSIPSLAGNGTYYVQIEINGDIVPTPNSPAGKVTFDLK